MVPETKGSYPLSDPRKTGRLDYAIVVEGIGTSALMDHGACFSFVRAQWCRDQGLQLVPRPDTLWLQQFGGGTLGVDQILKNAKVRFAGTTRRWTFLVHETTPAPIVIGLNMVLAWRLCFNPADHSVVAMQSTDPRAISTKAVKGGSSEVEWDEEDGRRTSELLRATG